MLKSGVIFLAGAVLAVAILAPVPAARAQAPGRKRPAPGPPKNLQVLPKNYTRPQVVAVMRTFAQGLGVHCEFCHVEGNFASDAKPTKQMARRMLRMVNRIDRDTFHGNREVWCYTCHRGQERPLLHPPATAAPARHKTRDN